MVELSMWELFLRLAVAAVLGGLIGFEREVSGQAAGMRTHLLVSLGAALFTIAGAYALHDFDDSVNFDPTRIAAQVVTGIGFLGAGAIIQSGLTIRGLTTAAGMWVAAGVGMTAAFGYWAACLGATFLAVVALYGLKILDRRILRTRLGKHVYLTLTTTEAFELHNLEQVIEEHHARLTSFRLRGEDQEGSHLAVNVHIGDRTKPVELARAITDLPGVLDVDSST